jgi:hypothetical protein
VIRPTRSIGILSALLLLTSASPALAQWPARAHAAREDGTDGVWNKRYWYTAGTYPVTNPEGVVFDPSRDEVIHFQSDGIVFKKIDSIGPGRLVRISGWPGIPLGCSAIYDPRRDRIIVLTVVRRGNSWGVDVFALGLGGPIQWELLVPSGTSPDLFLASATYDPVHDCMLVYGGVDPFTNEVRGEVRTLSLGGHPRWTSLETSGEPPPLRTGNTAIFDERHGELIVYGGRAAADGGLLGDVWALDLGPRPRWRQVKVREEAPANRAGHAAIYDGRRERMLITGGSRDHYVWALSLQGVPRWSRLDPSGEPPPGGLRRIAFADADDDRMVLMDGDGWWLWTLDWGGGTEAPLSTVPREDPLSGVDHGGREGSRPSLDVPSSVWRGDVLHVRVSLPGSSSARLGLFDLAGRRIWTAGPDAIGPGAHDVAITPSMPAARGVYFVRLEQGTYSTVRKVLRLP